MEEWAKYKRSVEQQKVKIRGANTSTLQETERAVVSMSSLEYEDVQQSLDSIRNSYVENYLIDDPMIESLDQIRINPNNLLLSPRIELPLRLLPKQIPKSQTPKLVLIVN